MASRNKQKKKGAFSYFLDEYVQKQQSKGRKVSYRIGAEECAPLWEKMPPEERRPYLEKAEVNRVYTQKEKETKFTSMGVSYAEIDRRIQEARNKVDRANKELASLMQKLDSDSISKHLFYMIHVHYLVKVEEDDIYMPGEIAVCEFNFKSGVRRTYHTLINSGPLPVGYGFEAKRRREVIHNLPIPPYEEGNSDYLAIVNDLIKFIEPGRSISGKYPPLYANEEEIPMIENVLQQFLNKLRLKQDYFRVYPVQKLLFELKNKCVALANNPEAGFTSETIASLEIERDTHRYVSGISCEYHTPSDEFYHSCSLSIIQRYVYMICDNCCEHLNIPLKPGKHTRREIEWSEEEEAPTQKKTTQKQTEKKKKSKGKKKSSSSSSSSLPQQNRFAFLNEGESDEDDN